MSLFLATLVAAALLPGAFRVETYNDPEGFFADGAPERAAHERLVEAFGNDETLRIVFTGRGLWTEAGLEHLATVESAASALEGVTGVIGPWARHRREASVWPPEDPLAYRRALRTNRLDRALGLVDEEGKVATALVTLASQSSTDRTRTLTSLDGLTESPPPGISVRLAGGPLVDRALDEASRQVSGRFAPLLVLVAGAILVAVFRRTRRVALPLAMVGFSELLILGPLGYAGVPLDLLLVIVPPLVLVVSLATAIHVGLRFDALVRERDEDALATARATFDDKGGAILWMGITTAAAFASLATSGVASVRTFGACASLAIAAMTAAFLLVYPALLALFGRRSGGASSSAGTSLAFRMGDSEMGRAWAEGAARHRRSILLVAGLLAAVALAGSVRLEIETDALSFLAPWDRSRQAVEHLEEFGIGVSAVELLVESRKGARLDRPEAMESWDRLGGALERDSRTLSFIGPAEVVRDAARLFPSTGLGPTPWPLLVGATRSDRDADARLAKLIAGDGLTARAIVTTTTGGARELLPFVDTIESEGRRLFPEAEVEATGRVPLLLSAQYELLRTLIVSLAITLLVVALCFRFLLGRWRFAFVAMIPNVWPVAGVVGLMGWLGLPLDVGTVMVSAVVLGLAVDDTIHTLAHFRELAPRNGSVEAIAGTLEITAPAYVLNGVVLGAGFATLAFADFAPTARFGGLCAAGMGLAVVGDLILIPALLASVRLDWIVRKS